MTPSEPQITLGTDKSFTYDYVFDMQDDQQMVYEKCAAPLVRGSLEGYNATILAYGQVSVSTYTYTYEYVKFIKMRLAKIIVV